MLHNPQQKKLKALKLVQEWGLIIYILAVTHLFNWNLQSLKFCLLMSHFHFQLINALCESNHLQLQPLSLGFKIT